MTPVWPIRGGRGVKLTGYLDSPHMLSQYLLIHSEAIKATIKDSVLKVPFLVGPGKYWFQRAGTRVLAPMGENRWFYKNLHIYKLKTYKNNEIQPFTLFLVDRRFCIQNRTTQKKC